MDSPTPWTSASKGAFLLCSHIYDANGSIVLMDVRTEVAMTIVACVNAIAGLDPSVVAELIAWAEVECKQNAYGPRKFRDIVSRLRGGPKG